MNSRSIRSQLTGWYTVVLSFGLVLFSCTVWLGLRHVLYADLTAALLDQVRGLEVYLHIEDQGRIFALVHEIDEYSRSLPQGHLLLVFDAAGHVIYRSASAPDRNLSELAACTADSIPHRLHWKDRNYLGVCHAVTLKTVALKKQRVQFFVAISSGAIDRAIHLLGLLLVLTVPLFTLAAAGGGYWLSRRALAPVDNITERARTIGVGNLSERLAVPNTNDELQRLTETWNDMLGRLDLSVRKISQFTADASHELRTPIAIVRLAAENALRKMRDGSEYRIALQQIQRESENMTRLVENLLFLARSDIHSDLDQADGTQNELIELRSLIGSVCTDLDSLASAKAIKLAFQVPDCAVTVLGSYSALRRMLLILLDNAIKYTPKGGFITVQLQQANGKAVLNVEDTGIGIPDEARPQVFQRFFRADPSRSKESGGYGLGLAIAQTIVHQHKAGIEFTSKQGGGCIFSVSLPLAVNCPSTPVNRPGLEA